LYEKNLNIIKKSTIITIITIIVDAQNNLAKEVKKDVQIAKEKLHTEDDAVVESAANTKDKIIKETKKTKEKSGGFLPGIFESAKHAAEEVSDDLKGVMDETKKETHAKVTKRLLSV